MQFKDIIGQEEVKAHIIKNINEGRVPHAQLFWGGEGVGKFALALATIQYLNCEHRNGDDSCGECESCRLISKLSHPDVHFSYPIVKGNTNGTSEEFLDEWREMVLESPYFNMHQWMERINEAGKIGTIYVSECESITKKLSFKSFKAKYKCLIIWLPEKMQEQGANKLLKLIEEPPADTLFFLVSEHPEMLLSTITSRTQALHIKNISVADLSTKVPEDIARLSAGNYIKALDLMNSQGRNTELVKRYRELMGLVFLKNLVGLKDFAATASESREETLEFLGYACNLTREVFIANLCNPNLNYRSADEVAFTEKFKRFVTETNIEGIIDNFTRAYEDVERNANIKLTMFDLGLQLLTLIKK
ncbi:MAG: DNA polymerase III subunit delta [Paludibacteraceae bacterium]|nr:DNA polymerase III subunit delta [Paludibacteraceae bacterium]